jgi:hypothetical protein
MIYSFNREVLPGSNYGGVVSRIINMNEKDKNIKIESLKEWLFRMSLNKKKSIKNIQKNQKGSFKI